MVHNSTRFSKRAKKARRHQTPGKRGGSYEETSGSYGVVLGIAVSTPGRDQVHDPTKRPGRADPGKTGYDQPDDANDDPAIVDLSDPGN